MQRIVAKSLSVDFKSKFVVGIINTLSYHNEASIYVHWPYCKKLCTYCNFNKYIERHIDHDLLASCYVQELTTLLRLSHVTHVTSVFFGGGTPSLAPVGTFELILDSLHRHAHVESDAEVTVEVNPTPRETGKLSDFAKLGVNRFSIGVQCLDDDMLRSLNRNHTVDDALLCAAEARRLLPERVSVDMMFGLPSQNLADWCSQLHKILQICDDHLSLYQLTLERGTALFDQVEKGCVVVPDGDTAADMYMKAIEILKNHGFVRYEVSNFARNNSHSKHNQSYWRGRQYIGVGPGAHGRFSLRNYANGQRLARIQTLEPAAWMKEVAPQIGVLYVLRRMEERLALGLRMADGIPHKDWAIQFPAHRLSHLLASSPDLQSHFHDGLLILDDRGLRTSPAGLNILDRLLPDILNSAQAHYTEDTN